MAAALWTGMLLCGLAAGAAVCGWLVVPRRLTVPMVAAGVGAAAGSTLCFATLLHGGIRPDASIAAVVLCVATALGGYALVAALLTGSGHSARLVKLDAPAISHDGTAFCLLADAEPTDYDPLAVTAALAALEASDVTLPPEAMRPLVYFAERTRYAANGPSPAQATVAALAERMAPLLGAAPVPCWCATSPTVADVLRAAKEAGAARAVIVLLSVAETRLTDAALAEAGTPSAIPFLVSPPIWSRASVAEHVTGRVLDAVGSFTEGRTGIVLAGNGQPAQWDRSHPEAREQETYFCQRVRTLLATDGIPADDVRMAWVEWTEPGVTDTVRHLAALGCDRALVVPTAMPFDSLSTLIDLRGSCEEAAAETGIPVELLPAWGDSDVVARTLAAIALETLAEHGSEA